jgi:hypothetical protein
MIEPGDVVTMWDWPEVTYTAFDKRRRCKVRGKIKTVHPGFIDLWAEQADYRNHRCDGACASHPEWGSLRTLPREFLIVEDLAARRMQAQADELASRERSCEACGKSLAGKRANAKSCSDRCRKTMTRKAS